MTPRKEVNSSLTMGMVALSLVRGMLMRLPARVPTRIMAADVELKPTSLNAKVAAPMKIRPRVMIRMSIRIPRNKKL